MDLYTIVLALELSNLTGIHLFKFTNPYLLDLVSEKRFTGIVLQNFSEKSHNICGKTPTMETFFLTRKYLHCKFFPVNFEKSSRTAFLIEHLQVVAAVI